MPTFTTVIPAYNCGTSIAQTLRSIEAQTRKCDQVIVVDDGSSDDTEAVIKASFDWVDYIKIQNSGVSVARNTGFERASGDWIALCDSDDIWHPDKLRIVENCIQQAPDCRLFFHDFYLFGEGVEDDNSAVSEGPRSIFPFFRETGLKYRDLMPQVRTFALDSDEYDSATLRSGNIFEKLILGNIILPSAVVLNAGLIASSGGFDPNFRKAEDSEFFLRLSKHEIFSYLNLPLTGYRIGNGGLTSNKSDLLDHGMKALYKNCVADKQVYAKYQDTIDLAIARRYGRMASVNLKKRNRLDAWANIQKGLRYRFSEAELWKILIASLIPYFILERMVGAGKQ
jgi:glycosyltransferase involved in cell wall biosynthesis